MTDDPAARLAASTTEWVLQMVALDRPGTVTAITNVFSSRGVSFGSLVTGSSAGAASSVILTFRASRRRAVQLARTLGRLAAIDEVVLRAADDADVMAAAVVVMPAGSTFRPPPTARVAWSGISEHGQPVLAEGQLLQVRAVLDAARAAGARSTTLVVLPMLTTHDAAG